MIDFAVNKVYVNGCPMTSLKTIIAKSNQNDDPVPFPFPFPFPSHSDPVPVLLSPYPLLGIISAEKNTII